MWISTAGDLAQLIRDRRKELRISQAVLARRIGVTRQWIGMLERGKPTVELAAVLKAMAALGLRLDVRASAAPGVREPAAPAVPVPAVPIAPPAAARPLRRLPTQPTWRRTGDDAARSPARRARESA
jgi:y4mF family transcriptional regulator